MLKYFFNLNTIKFNNVSYIYFTFLMHVMFLMHNQRMCLFAILEISHQEVISLA